MVVVVIVVVVVVLTAAAVSRIEKVAWKIEKGPGSLWSKAQKTKRASRQAGKQASKQTNKHQFIHWYSGLRVQPEEAPRLLVQIWIQGVEA